ncbi:MAG: trypsin-like peptidase domain-containing protein, partial [Spirochaetales bacterium]
MGTRSSVGRKITIGFAVVVLAGFGGAQFVQTVEAQSPQASSNSPLLETPASEDVLWAHQNAFRRAAQVALPVVVKIDVAEVVRQRSRSMPSPFDFFFGRDRDDEGEEREFTRTGLGSGVIVQRSDEMVYVLTNDHVVGDADEITVSLHDGRQFEARLLGTDSRRDLAIVVFETRQEVPIAQLGNSDDLEVGDWIFAVGNPLGFESTVTSGIVSAVGRRPSSQSSISQLTDYIQTDAAINQGNSGGALVNLVGEVVGINTWIASRSGGSIGLGFAIPINNAKESMEELITLGSVQDGWLGILGGPMVDEAMAESLGLDEMRGALIASVFEESPAHQAGLLPGDVIVRIDRTEIDNFEELALVIADIEPGTTVPFRVARGSRTLTVRVTLSLRNDESVASY